MHTCSTVKNQDFGIPELYNLTKKPGSVEIANVQSGRSTSRKAPSRDVVFSFLAGVKAVMWSHVVQWCVKYTDSNFGINIIVV